MNTIGLEVTGDVTGRSEELLQNIEQNIGFVPNVYRALAGSSTVLKALVALTENFEDTTFTPAEREIIALTTSVYNCCPYCVAGHSTFALQHGVDPKTIKAIRDGEGVADQRMRALQKITLNILERKGELGAAEIRPFLNAGFDASQILELLIGVAGKIMSNFASKIFHVPLDDMFVDQLWVPPHVTSTTTD